MTEKDYIAIAAILNREYRLSRDRPNLVRTANQLCTFFKADNRLFSADKFMEIVLKEK